MVKNRHFLRHFGTSLRFSGFYFLTDFDAFKKCFKVIFSRSLTKSDQKTCIAALKPEMFWFDLFHLVI